MGGEGSDFGDLWAKLCAGHTVQLVCDSVALEAKAENSPSRSSVRVSRRRPPTKKARMSEVHVKRAMEAKAKAEKKLKSWGMFGNKYEDAADLYEQAANSFKLGKQWEEAAKCFDQLAECHVKLDSIHEAASAMSSAAGCIKKAEPKKAIPFYNKSADYFCNLGRLGMAAKSYREAAEQLETENQTSETNKCKLKIATMNAELEKYNKSIKLFEEVAKKSVDNNLLKYSVKGYLLQAG